MRGRPASLHSASALLVGGVHGKDPAACRSYVPRVRRAVRSKDSDDANKAPKPPLVIVNNSIIHQKPTSTSTVQISGRITT